MSVSLELPDELIEALTKCVIERLQEEPERRFLSKRALAEYLGVPERRVKTLRERGLPARRVGRDLYFDMAEVNAWLDREGSTTSRTRVET
jgi:excisionase family DNA binding protein